MNKTLSTTKDIQSITNRVATDADIRKSCEAAQILEFIEGLPEGFNTTVGERGLKLSGGEKQRIAIARAILRNPPIVLLDEATSALDSVTEKAIQSALENLGRNRTVLVIAHRLSTIRNVDEIIVLENGRIAEKGTHEKLMSSSLPGIYRRLWEEQVKMNIEDIENIESK